VSERKSKDVDLNRLIDEALGPGLVEAEQADFAPTEGARALIGHIQFAARNQFPFALVVGPAGVGKTFVCQYWARQNGAPWLRAKPDWSPKALLEELAQRLRLTQLKTYMPLLNMVRDALLMAPRVVFVDEAQLCHRGVLEVLKFLADETGSSFVLITSEEFAPLIRAHRDIESRIGTVAQVGPISQEETLQLYSGTGYSKEVLQEVHALTGGILRDVVRLLRIMDGVAEQNGIPKDAFKVGHVRRVAARLNLAGGAR
jgi:DNA transposition AAA+ family ATPase